MTSHKHATLLTRTESLSTISTNATADNLPGPGRTIDRIFQCAGRRIELLLNKFANRVGMGPAHIAQEIRLLCGHHKFAYFNHYPEQPGRLSEVQLKVLRNRCNALMKFVGSRLLSTQLVALEEVTTLAIDDSLIRAIILECHMKHLEPKYLEPSLLLVSAKALASVKEADTHALWATIKQSDVRQRFRLNHEDFGKSLTRPPPLKRGKMFWVKFHRYVGQYLYRYSVQEVVGHRVVDPFRVSLSFHKLQ
ncbi:hypothetical protein SCHPADRAFT_895441 [Schizopora paradoxa]|uniref:Uncharacterized protein n=1 Tax=Schizopora paradoxa TaxID=27342 RepID=A0A0H2RAC8_9AGAM|nr:hypothetical protein SCHPADRAFT_895441 [Schizopora paradoxa]